MIDSYPDVVGTHHKDMQDLFDGEVAVQEKLDGSQFAFKMGLDGKLELRSKGASIIPDQPRGMFAKATATVVSIQDKLTPGWTYRGEVLDRPKHNALTYGRVPVGNVILFDVEVERGKYLPWFDLRVESERLGLACVPCYWSGPAAPEIMQSFLGNTSILGGPIEGIVIKNYGKTNRSGEPLFGKLVREEFREVRKMSEPKAGVIEKIINSLATEARWRKAIQHLGEQDLLVNAPQDIGPLLKEISADVLKEEEETIKQMLFDGFWKDIIRKSTKGFPEYYKRHLEAQDVQE